MNEIYDLIIIGAGPTGLAAATTAATCGVSSLVLDEQPQPGGQIYRNIEAAAPADCEFFGQEYRYGKKLSTVFRQSTATYLPGATVWDADPIPTVCYSINGASARVAGRKLLVATGAMERPVPIPGWERCGVMGAGAADILLKSANLVPSSGVVLCGNGPLLMLVATHYLKLGIRIQAILETGSPARYLSTLPAFVQTFKAPGYLFRGAAMQIKLIISRVPWFTGVTDIEAVGDERVTAVRFTYRKMSKEIPTRLLLLHNGVVPHTRLSRHLKCQHVWDKLQRCSYPQTDRWGHTTVEGVYAAGDTAGVAGAKIAELKGRITALEVAYQLDKLSKLERDTKAAPLFKQLTRERAARPFIDTLFAPSRQLIVPQKDATLVCRCEEVTAGDIRQAVRQGFVEVNGVKTATRCGMGPCQGRMCGLTTAEIIADELGVDVPESGSYRIRPPLKPIFLEEFARMELLP